MKKRPKKIVAQESSPLALVAEASAQEEQIVAETVDDKPVGVLRHDFERAALILNVTGDIPAWKTVDVEIKTRDDQLFTRQEVPIRGRPLVLLEETPLQPEDVIQITLKLHQQRAPR